MRVSDTYTLKLLQSKHDELLAAFEDVHQRLTALEAENEKLRAALKPFASINFNDCLEDADSDQIWGWFFREDVRDAVAALKEKVDE